MRSNGCSPMPECLGAVGRCSPSAEAPFAERLLVEDAFFLQAMLWIRTTCPVVGAGVVPDSERRPVRKGQA